MAPTKILIGCVGIKINYQQYVHDITMLITAGMQKRYTLQKSYIILSTTFPHSFAALSNK